MFIKIISIKHLQYVHILNLILVIIKFIWLLKTASLLFSLSLPPPHLSILQYSKYIAIYISYIDEKLKITRKHI